MKRWNPMTVLSVLMALCMENLPSGIMLCMISANERGCYTVMSSLIGWAHTQDGPYAIQAILPVTFIDLLIIYFRLNKQLNKLKSDQWNLMHPLSYGCDVLCEKAVNKTILKACPLHQDAEMFCNILPHCLISIRKSISIGYGRKKTRPLI